MGQPLREPNKRRFALGLPSTPKRVDRPTAHWVQCSMSLTKRKLAATRRGISAFYKWKGFPPGLDSPIGGGANMFRLCLAIHSASEAICIVLAGKITLF